MAGFEGADHINSAGKRLSMNDANQHMERLDEDYRRLNQMGIFTARESIGWRVTELQGQAGLARLRRQAQLAASHGIEVSWSLMHYGWPEGIDLFSMDFVDRFGQFSEKVARTLRQAGGDSTQRVYQPINEISFLSWALSSTGLMNGPANNLLLQGRGSEIKRQLVRAALRACEVIGAADPAARFLHTDPLMHVVAPMGAGPELELLARQTTAHSFEAWDMLCGRTEAHLGGSPKHLDIVGVNYYHKNQTELGSSEGWLEWHRGNPRRKPLSQMLTEVWERYGRPLVIAETSHVGVGRSQWLDHVAAEVEICRHAGVPVEGICLFPIIDRPSWDDETHWHHSGLWDVQARQPGGACGNFDRTLCVPYGQHLRHWQARLPDNFHSDDFLPWPLYRASAPGMGSAAATFPEASPPFNNPGEPAVPTIIVFSHLRWNFVYQRPQHLLSRLAGHYRIIFMEEPMQDAPYDHLEQLSPAPDVVVLRPHLQGSAVGFHDDHLPILKSQLADFLRHSGIKDYLLWFYTPMALPLASGLAPRAVIYDVMDELSAFKNAPRQLVQRENALYQQADLVLTGGPSLYRAKLDRHPNVHCFSSSVDAAHFAPRPGGPSDHTLQSLLGTPRLGYCGVIDERIDLDLIAALADAHADWQIVMVGPVVKINPDSLPHRANIHWLGQQSYEDLPHFMAGWNVCLLPFALNESTEFISPTKTLEYMAAGKPSVSTRIRDVAEPYGHVVAIADTHQEFIAACEALLAQTSALQSVHAGQMREVVAGTSWDATASAIRTLIEAMPLRGHGEAANSGFVPWAAGESIADTPARHEHARKPSNSRQAYSTVVLGAGPTGLAAACELGESSLLLEKGSTVGGWCRSIEDGGFTFDYAGHIMFSNDPYVLELYEKLLGTNMHWQNREAWVYSKEVFTRYPFQGALYGLPPEVLKECLVGAIEARFGAIKKENSSTPAVTPPGARSALASVAPTGKSSSPTSAPGNFEEFIYKVWGAGVAKHFAIPYNQKLWAVPLHEMETSWLGGRVPMPDLEEMIDGALRPVTKPMGPNARFGYPLKGGFQALMDGFLPLLRGDVEMQAEVVEVSPSRRTVTLADGRSYRYETLISTLALPRLVEAMGDEAPEQVKAAAKGLRHVSVRCVNLGIGREALTDKHWIYYPEDTVFHRIFVQGNASPHCNAPGGFGLTCEITYSEYKPLPCDGQALIDRCISDCVKVGMIKADDAVWVANQVDMPYAYVVYDHDRARHVETIRNWVAKANILLAGRYSEWEYYNSDHAFVAGKKAAGQAQQLLQDALETPRAAAVMKPAA